MKIQTINPATEEKLLSYPVFKIAEVNEPSDEHTYDINLGEKQIYSFADS